MEPLPILKLTLSGDSALHILEKRKMISTMAKDIKQEGIDGEACKDMGLGKGGHTLPHYM